MSNQVLPPKPSLVAIILVVRTGRGVKHAFHYPPEPGKDKPHAKLDYETSPEDETSSSSDADSYSSLEDDDGFNLRARKRATSDADADYEDNGSLSPEKSSPEDWRKRTEYDSSGLLGLPAGFASFLCPPSQCHKKRFELTIGQLVFLGHPVFAREDGEWRRKRKTKTTQPPHKMSTISEQELAGRGPGELTNGDEARGEDTIDESVDEDQGATTTEDEGARDLQSPSTANVNGAVANSVEEEKPADENTKPRKSVSDLTMFHVVFVMNPSPLEYQARTDDMYKHVVKKFSRALKREQERSGYVQRECERMKLVKGKHDSALQDAIRHSHLARAIATLYTSISTSRIANIDLTTHNSFSLQIPIPTSISTLPDALSPQLPGLWLTTSTLIPSNDDLHLTRSKLASHFALLLLSDLSTILAEIASNVSSPLSAPLTTYLRATTSRKSFLQISQSTGMSLSDIHLLASHLIYWRRARAIPPLNQRDIYIVSPNCDMRKLKSGSLQYAKLFPAQIPSLPKMLSLLSASPRPFFTLIPSKDHKDVYMDVLAWLMRGGWVTQLRTFAWVRVPPSIQEEVYREQGDLEGDTDGSVKDAAQHAPGHADSAWRSPNAPLRTRMLLKHELLSGALSPRRASGVSSVSSASSAQTAVPLDGSGRIAAPSPSRAAAGSDYGGALTSRPPTSATTEEPFSVRIILNPTKASGLESRYLSAIEREIEAAEGAETREAWERCLKYLNGEHALETVPVREGWKRKRLEAMRATWERMGLLVQMRHW